tara:strand:+ start:1097 stop:2236 length:1140 start_codon:yes stop_codon:yes gene_type:complete
VSVFPIAPDGVLLHVGVHKTGTTAIQAALADSRRELASRDVRYPGKLQAQHRAALALLGRPWGWNNRGGGVMDREHFDRLVRRTRKAPGRVVISSEFFCEASSDQADEVVSALGRSGARPVHVVITLRNLGKLLPSSWQQYLKYGMTTSYEAWLTGVLATPGSSKMSPTFWKRHDHGDVIRRWAGAVGPQNLTVMVLEDVPREYMFETFAQFLDVPTHILTSRMELTSNRSMTAAEAEVLVRLNKKVKKSMQWSDYVTLVRRGVALGMVEGREPGPSEPKLHTPDWALDAAQQMGIKSVNTIRESKVNVLGNLDALRTRIASTPAPDFTDQIPIDAAVTAIESVINSSREEPSSRELAGRLYRQTKKDGIGSLLRKDSE